MEFAQMTLAFAAFSVFLWTVWRANRSSRSDGVVVKILLFCFSVTSFTFFLLSATSTEEPTHLFGFWLLVALFLTLSGWLWWGSFRYMHLLTKLGDTRDGQ
jgi:hypothetical protein